MCQSPAFKYQAFANNENVPEGLRKAAALQIEAQKELQKIIESAKSTVPTPAGGNKQFTCTIYNLENKDVWERMTANRQKEFTNLGEVTHLPGVKVQDSSGFKDTSPDTARERAYEGLQHVYDFYKTVFGRESIDGEGMEIRASIHHSRGVDNAFWSPSQKQMVFGDGGRFDGRGWLIPTEKEIEDDIKETDPKKKRGFAVLSEWFDNYDIDTIGHELTHGVVQFTAALGAKQWDANQGPQYSEAATLNEHIADSFAIALKHWVNKQDSHTGNWDFSPNVFSELAMKTQRWQENYCRTFRVTTALSNDFGKNHPKHWDNHLPWNKDGSLDPHVNCGIPNHAFYQAALAFNGNTWETVGKIWYDALTDKDFTDPTNQTFKFWRDLTVKYAEKHFQASGKDIMVKAWQKVGM